MTLKTKMIGVRLTEAEDNALRKLAENLGEPYSRVLRKMIRECINQTPDLLGNDLILFRLAIRQLMGAAHNLNQLVKAVHAGFSPFSLDARSISELRSSTLNVKKELESYVMRTKQRWVMFQ